MRLILLSLLLIIAQSVSAALDSSPEDSDIFKAHYKRMMAAAELVFVYESADTTGSGTAGSAFLVEINDLTYVATNWHVMESIIFEKDKAFELTNQFGRKLLITSPFYYKLKVQSKPRNIPIPEDSIYDEFWNDIVLIPYTMQFFKMKAFQPAKEPAAQENQTAIALGNTLGQGFINEKEGIINFVNDYFFGMISGATSGNSGGPVITLQNEVIGMLSGAGEPEELNDEIQNICIRMDLRKLEFYMGTQQFEKFRFPTNSINFYTEDLIVNYRPEEHHSRDKNTPHLSIGLAGGGMGLSGGRKYSWDINRRERIHKPLKCYNWDIIPRERLEKLCITYGQTIVDFIPDHWVELYYSDTIHKSFRKHEALGFKYTEALRSRRKMESYTTRAARMTNAKRSKILDALRDIYNARHETGKKMRKNGDIVDISECIENLDAGL